MISQKTILSLLMMGLYIPSSLHADIFFGTTSQKVNRGRQQATYRQKCYQQEVITIYSEGDRTWLDTMIKALGYTSIAAMSLLAAYAAGVAYGPAVVDAGCKMSCSVTEWYKKRNQPSNARDYCEAYGEPY